MKEHEQCFIRDNFLETKKYPKAIELKVTHAQFAVFKESVMQKMKEVIVATVFVGYYLLANASNPTCPCSQGR